MTQALLAIQWDPDITGYLAVAIGVVVLCGSVYLLLATNVGTRLGFLISLCGLAGWMFLMGIIWWVYGIGLVGDGPVYVSFDVDGLDPVYAPGTGTPEIGGFTSFEAQAMLRGLQGLNLVGGDVVEVAPPFDQTGYTALTGVTMMFEILCVLADALAVRR